MNDKITISLYQLMKRFPNAESAREFLEEKRWNGHISCPHCGCSDIYHRTNRIGYYRCRKCPKEFTVRTKSIFEHSNIPLDKWIFAIYMILTARKGMSSLQMSKELSITQKSTWFMQHRIRTAMSHGKYADMLKGIVEVDETYIGGKEDNKHASKKLNAGRGAIGKTPVFGIKQRNGKVVSMVVPDTTKERLQTIIGSMVVPGTTVNTDDSKSYNGLNIKGYTHNVVNHSAKQYVDGMAYTNSIESVWSVLKRGFYGTFHKFIIKHLQRYVDEFDFRLNDGNVKIPTDERINSVICGCWGKIMPYKTLKII